MAAGINKAVVPRDYARLLCSVSGTSKFQKLTALTATHDLTSTSSNENNRIDVSSLPSYDMVGEIECIYPKGSMSSISPLTNNIYTAISRFKLDPEILSKYRLIRLIVQPNFYLFVSSNKLTLYYKVQLTFDGGSTYYTITDNSGRGLQIAGNWGPQALVEYTTKLAFMFDTKTKEFYRDTKSTALWNSDEIEPITEEEYSNTKVTPHKAVVPNDYSITLYEENNKKTISTTAGGTSITDLTNIEIPSGRAYVGEVKVQYSQATTLSATDINSVTFEGVGCSWTIKLIFNINTNSITKRFRFIRFTVTPNAAITNNTSGLMNVWLCFYVTHGTTYTCNKKISGSTPIPSLGIVTTETYSFLYDTKTHEITPEFGTSIGGGTIINPGIGGGTIPTLPDPADSDPESPFKPFEPGTGEEILPN